MTETQINHRAPLAPGEIRTHTVGDQRFAVMHIANGSFTQASVCNVRDGDGPTRVLRTSQWERDAVGAYADAIEQAESDAVDALDDADGMSFDASGAYLDGETGIATTPDGGMAPETVSWVSRPDGSGLRRSGERSWVTGEPLGEFLPTPEPGSLSALLDAYGEAMARGGIELASGRTVQDGIAAAVAHTTRADALKAEILGRFGDER